MKKLIISSLLILSGMASSAIAANYVIDTAKAHAFIQFRIKHLGYSWLYGRFNSFEGSFSYDEKILRLQVLRSISIPPVSTATMPSVTSIYVAKIFLMLASTRQPALLAPPLKKKPMAQ